MATIEEVVKIWDKTHPDMQTGKLKGKNVQPDGKIIFGKRNEKPNKQAVIKLSDGLPFEPWGKRVCYVFTFYLEEQTNKCTDIEISFQRRIKKHPNTQNLIEFLNKNFCGKLVNSKKLFLKKETKHPNQNPNHVVLKAEFPPNLSDQDICNSMEELIKLTQGKILEIFYPEYSKLKEFDEEYSNYQTEIQNTEPATQKEIENSANRRLEFSKKGQSKVVKRNGNLAKSVLQDANYKCQIDTKHKTFTNIRGVQYMEAHHLIPCTVPNSQKFYKKYSKNIDCYENIICLCPTCHRAIHLSNENTKEKIIKSLFTKQSGKLNKIGIKITEKELLKLYIDLVTSTP